ncbi:MAG: FAD:protein FMN transferase [Planctomycetaceae bacterium]|nr:FAD:protein FMN transferase [Planctomycetaceae bacterium]
MWYRASMAVLGVVLALMAIRQVDGNEPLSTEGEPLQRFEFLQIRMAIPVRITVYAADEPTANQASQAAYARFRQLDRILSHYDPDSELSQLCKQAVVGQPTKVSRELFTVIAAAEYVSQQSEGAFDATVGPLMDLWRKSRKAGILATDIELAEARQKVGYQYVSLDPDAQTVTFLREGIRLDLGGIAKGYAADEALRVLREQGIERALIDAGGDIVAGAPPPGKESWLIGIAPLDTSDAAPTRFLQLSHCAVATSGDSVQFVEIDGVRYSHILDPRTGLGLTSHSSVTVIAHDGITADAWASAVSVLGAEKGVSALTQSVPTAEAFVVAQTDSQSERVDTPGFSRYEVVIDRKPTD